ncbi:MAG: thiamine phosphate synthase [Candidatus Omnitrophica bacterium]|nr:thiamine phosphate synthase [Candidatus Omnitrophota bacterium]
MQWRKKLLKDSKLYLILDTEVCGYGRLLDIAKKAFRAGVNIFQIRDKRGSVQEMLLFSQKMVRMLNKKALFIVNDRVDVALAADADGVHVGQEDLPCSVSRDILGSDKLVGVSCQTLRHVERAQQAGADYIGFGSVFKTLTKPGRQAMDLNFLKHIVKESRIPLFAIGGINFDNIYSVTQAGVSRVAICRAICQARDVERTTKSFKDFLAGKKYGISAGILRG